MKKEIVSLFALLVFCYVAIACSANDDCDADQEESVPTLWYQSSSEYDQEKLDVLYFVSTNVLSAKDEQGNVVWRSQLVPEDIAAMKKEIDNIARNMFYDDFNLLAPYYHQVTFDGIIQLDRQSYNAEYAKVAREACKAFDYYMEKVNKGRQFVLAGYSQGGIITLDILKHMTDEQYSRMVACYTMGYRLSAEDLKHPHIKAATGEMDKGVVISFNSVQKREAIWSYVTEGAATCINPVNWKTDATPATFTFRETSNEVHVDTVANVLIVKTDTPKFYYDYFDRAPFFEKAGVSRDNLHHWDMQFYARMIHDNALKRAGR